MPSLLRGLPNDQWQVKARLALERFRVAELELVLRNHPFKSVADSYGYDVDYHGLAQHYGMPTSLLDLTSNIEVAAFFAVARWDGEEQRWLPMDSGRGVFYRLDWAAFGPGYSKHFEPVGFGPGLRPARQHAWTFRPRLGVDFQAIPNVASFEFQHSRSASQAFFERFDDGGLLYPPDCMASLVEKVRDLPFLTMSAIRYAASQDGQPTDAVEIAAERAATFLNANLGLEIIDGYDLELEDADVAIAARQASALKAALDMMRKGFRVVRTPKEQ